MHSEELCCLSSHELYDQLIRNIGEDPERCGLAGTSKRAAKALEYLTKGYHESLKDIVNGAVFPCDADEMVIIRDIETYSLCEHHLLPFFGNGVFLNIGS